MKVASDRCISLVRYKLRLRYAYQIWTTAGPAREESRIHSFTGAVDVITMPREYFLTKTHMPTSIWGRRGGFEYFFQLLITPWKAKRLVIKIEKKGKEKQGKKLLTKKSLKHLGMVTQKLWNLYK